MISVANRRNGPPIWIGLTVAGTIALAVMGAAWLADPSGLRPQSAVDPIQPAAVQTIYFTPVDGMSGAIVCY
jgi:hypothetical protein